jgi:hypothetical protein
MVMNTAAEVEAAHEDLRRGRFGQPWSPSATDEEWRAIIRGTQGL